MIAVGIIEEDRREQRPSKVEQKYFIAIVHLHFCKNVDRDGNDQEERRNCP